MSPDSVYISSTFLDLIVEIVGDFINILNRLVFYMYKIYI